MPHHKFGELIGFKGIYVDDPDRVGAAWDEALAFLGPVVLEIKTDPEVAPLPPHINLKQAKNFLSMRRKGDQREGNILTDTARQVLSAVLRARSERPVGERRPRCAPRSGLRGSRNVADLGGDDLVPSRRRQAHVARGRTPWAKTPRIGPMMTAMAGVDRIGPVDHDGASSAIHDPGSEATSDMRPTVVGSERVRMSELRPVSAMEAGMSPAVGPVMLSASAVRPMRRRHGRVGQAEGKGCCRAHAEKRRAQRRDKSTHVETPRAGHGHKAIKPQPTCTEPDDPRRLTFIAGRRGWRGPAVGHRLSNTKSPFDDHVVLF